MRATREQPLEDGGPDGPASRRTSQVGFSIPQLQFSPVELKDTGDARASA